MDTYSDVFDDFENEILDSDNDIPTRPPCKKLQSVPQF